MDDENDCENTDAWFKDLEDRFKKDVSSLPEKTLDVIVETIVDEFFDDAVLEVVFDVHKDSKMLNTNRHMEEEDIKAYAIIDMDNGDIFGQQLTKVKSTICHCPRCQRALCSSAFTSHLEKCVGIGRSSARLANLRISNTKYGGTTDDDDEDSSGPERPKKKRTTESKKNQDKKLKRGKNRKAAKETILSEDNED